MECKHDIKESKGNMFNPIVKENVQGRKHTERCAFPEPTYAKKAPSVDQKVINGHKNPSDSHIYHDKIMMKNDSILGIVTGAPNDIQR